MIEFDPAPGQFVQVEAFNDPSRALGPPSGGGTAFANQSSVVSLGGFGGSITLAFDHPVEDEPLNPCGMDAIVFSNALWVSGDSDRRFSEAAVIEICLDINADDCASGPWYLIPGSHIVDLDDQWTIRTWDDVVLDPTYGPAMASWIPPGRSGVWSTVGFLLPLAPFAGDALRVIMNPLAGTGREGIYGYAEYSPTLLLGDLNGDNIVDDTLMTADEFYTVPDDPMTAGITPGAGGGDAFDMAWAIDVETGEAAGLSSFTHIRLTCGVDSTSGLLGEVSPEIDAVADVRPDPFGDSDNDGDIDLIDMAALQGCFATSAGQQAGCDNLHRDENKSIDLTDAATILLRMTGPK